MKDVTLNQREQARLQVLNSVLEYQLPTTQAAEVLGISERQVRRILAAYRREGAAALVHGNRGRQSRNTIPEETASAVVVLASGKYAGFNHSHLSEVLAEREGIHLSSQTVSRLLNRHGLSSASRHRPPKHRIRRERMPQEGMLLQIDQSHHAWLEERGPGFVLLLAVDDATGTVANAVFQTGEDTRGYFLLMEGVIRRYGLPLALYGDRHGVFKFAGKPRHIQPPVEATHFSRAVQELGIEQVFARSPQAKGRVERMAGTFQDWLVSELRLAGAVTIDQANAVLQEFLPQFNRQFRVPAQQPKVAYRSLDASVFLERVLCFKHTRQVARDNTIKFQWRTLQLLPGEERPSYAGARVEVLEQSGGQLMVRSGGEVIPHQEAPPRPGALRASNGAQAPTPEMAHVVRNLARRGLTRLQLQRLAALEAAVPQRPEDAEPRRPDAPPPGRVPRASRPSGKPFTTPGSRVYPFEASPGTWVFPETRSGSTWT
ncbi:MAG: ISNCY family transposase [Chloroflexi bacterium]|nr:ISNCY family transposase [Chloroflexota bacterium]